jgi:hypothetical protein
VILARQKEDSWMVAGLAGDSAAYAEWSLEFLEPGKSYRARIIHDIPMGDILQSPTAYGDAKFVVNATDRFPCNMLPGGGFLMWITPADSVRIDDAPIQRFVETTGSYRNAFANRSRFGTMRSIHQGISKQVTYNIPYSSQYDAGGLHGLNDGLRGGLDYTTGGWQGFLGSGIDIIVDMGAIDTLRKVSVGLLDAPSSWIFFPEGMELLCSSDGLTYQPINRDVINLKPATDPTAHRIHEVRFDQLNILTRYIRLRSFGNYRCPDGHPGAGQPAWLFADEVMIHMD